VTASEFDDTQGRVSFWKPQKKIDEKCLGPALELGVGGLSRVLKRRPGEVEKSLLPKYQAKPLYESLIRREYDVLSGLSHSGIVKALRLEARSTPFHSQTSALILEEIKGWSLSEVLPQLKSLDLYSRRLWGACFLSQLTEILRYLESEKWVHADLSPENMMISEDGRLKLIDFALAHRRGEAPQHGFVVRGKPGFRLPDSSDNHLGYEKDLFASARVVEEVFGVSISRLEPEAQWIQTLERVESIHDLEKRGMRLGSDRALDVSFLSRSHLPFLKRLTPLLAAPKPVGLVSQIGGLMGLAVVSLSLCPFGVMELNTLPATGFHLSRGGSVINGETPAREVFLARGAYILSFDRSPLKDLRVSIEHSGRLKVFEDLRSFDDPR